MVAVELKKWGNSIGVILPAEKLKELNLIEGDTVELDLVKKEPRDGFGLCKSVHSFEEEKESHTDFW